MIRTYLLLNALLYAGFALWCTIKHTQTAQSIGYVSLNNAGHSEYTVLYGGLQLGLAIFFAYLGASDELYRTGAIFSLMLYAPIVLYRVVTVARYWPTSNLTLATGALETAMLIGALIALQQSAH
jgi:hypothetical protein